MHAEASMPSPWNGPSSCLGAVDGLLVQNQVLPLVAADLVMQQFNPVGQPAGPVKRPAHNVLQAAFKKPNTNRDRIRKLASVNRHTAAPIAIANDLTMAKAVKQEHAVQTDKEASEHAAALLELAHVAAQEIEARQKTIQQGDRSKLHHRTTGIVAPTWTQCLAVAEAAPAITSLHQTQPSKLSLPTAVSNICLPLSGMPPNPALEMLQAVPYLPGLTSSVPCLTLTPSPSCPNNLGTDGTMSGPFRSGRSSAAPALATHSTTASLAGLAVMQSQLKVMHDWYVTNKDAYLTEATVHLHLLQETNKPVEGQQHAGMAAVCRAMEKALEIMRNTAAQVDNAWKQSAAVSPNDPSSSPDTLHGSISAHTPIITHSYPAPGTLLVDPTQNTQPSIPFIGNALPVACGIPTNTV